MDAPGAQRGSVRFWGFARVANRLIAGQSTVTDHTLWCKGASLGQQEADE
jgi:hypothetical protein